MAEAHSNTATVARSSSKQDQNPVDTSALLLSLPPPTDKDVTLRLAQIDELKYFLATATNSWDPNVPVKTFPLPAGESISCVLWNNLFHITGTDIVRSLIYRFHAFGRPVSNLKKFEEGIFSDLRNLKPGIDACLEEPKSEFLDMLYKNSCIRTQKKQKVFYWFSVPHDRLFLDALERDLKREKMGTEVTSMAVTEPATSLSLDATQELFDQLRKSMSLSAAATAQALGEQVIPQTPFKDTTADRESACIRNTDSVTSSTWIPSWKDGQERASCLHYTPHAQDIQTTREPYSSYPVPFGQPEFRPNRRSTSSSDSSTDDVLSVLEDHGSEPSYTKIFRPTEISISRAIGRLDIDGPHDHHPTAPNSIKTKQLFGMFSLFEGSPSYKQRRRRATSFSSLLGQKQTHNPLERIQTIGSDQIRRHTSCHYRSPSNPIFSHMMNDPIYDPPPNRLEVVPIGCGEYYPQERFGSKRSPELACPSIPSFNPAIYRASHATTLCREDGSDSERVFTCPLGSCGRLFKRLEHLKRHMRTHTMERPYVCHLCGKRFSRSDNLSQHRKTHQKLQSKQAKEEGDNDKDGSSFGHNNQKPHQRHNSQPSKDTNDGQPPQDKGNTMPNGFQAAKMSNNSDNSSNSSSSRSSRSSTLSPTNMALNFEGQAYDVLPHSDQCKNGLGTFVDEVSPNVFPGYIPVPGYIKQEAIEDCEMVYDIDFVPNNLGFACGQAFSPSEDGFESMVSSPESIMFPHQQQNRFDQYLPNSSVNQMMAPPIPEMTFSSFNPGPYHNRTQVQFGHTDFYADPMADTYGDLTNSSSSQTSHPYSLSSSFRSFEHVPMDRF
ncbi:STE like transcription factor-domain-containing protein [Phycomyces nitens]|nr:STE like transcription factor-domain-containing protein [Phycomyces nitens]